MSINYRLYRNAGAGGPVDYTSIIATVSGLTWATPPLDAPSDNTFAVRAFDTVSGLEETNVDARVRIVIDASGNDISDRPPPPTGLTARARGTGAFVSWQSPPAIGAKKPTGFRVYVGTPTPDYGTIAATVPFAVLRAAFTATLTGLAPGDYRVGVRAYNASGEELNTISVPFTVAASGPLPVDDLTGSAVP